MTVKSLLKLTLKVIPCSKLESANRLSSAPLPESPATPEWIMITKKIPSHYRLHWADIGPIAPWSIPKDKKAKPKWPFSSASALAAESKAFDFYFVDGRFRVASVAACMLHAAKHGKSPAQFKIGIHDFRNRAHNVYKDILTIATPIKSYLSPVKTNAHLAILHRKKNVTDNDTTLTRLNLWNDWGAGDTHGVCIAR